MKTLTRFCRRSAITAACLLGLLAMPQVSAQQPFVVEGELTGVPDGTVLLLSERQGNVSQNVACDTLCDGRFRFQGMASGVQLFTVRLFDEILVANIVNLWVQSGDSVRIKGNGECGFEWQVTSTNPMQAEETAYIRAAIEEYRLMDKNLAVCGELDRKIRQVPESQRQALEDSLKNFSEQLNSLSCRGTAKQFALLKQRYLKDGKVKPLSPCAEQILFFATANAVYGKDGVDADEMRAFYNMIPEERRQSYDMQQVGALLFPTEVVKQGDTMYDGAVLYDLQGGQHRLSDYNKGKYLLLDFWSSGCGPCIAAFPELKEVSEELKDSLVVISLSEDVEQVWKAASEQHHITWENLNDLKGRTDVFAHYGINAIPFYAIISPEGKIVKTFTGYSQGRIKQKLSGIFPQYKNRVVRHPFAIQGHVGDMSDGSVVTLLSEQGGAMVKVATDTIRGGFFYLEGIDEKNHQYELQVARNGEGGGVTWRGLWIQPGDNVVIQGDGQYLKAWDIRSDNPLQAEQAVYDKAALDEAVKVEMLNMQMHAVGARFNKAAPDEIPTLRDSMMLLDRRKDALEDEAMARQFLAMKQYYMAGDTIAPLTPCGESLLKSIAYAVRYVKDFPVAEDVRAFYKQLPESYRQTAVGENIGVMLFPPEVVKQGDRMYDGAVLYDLQGGQHRLSDYNKGKYLLLDFWGSGCGPCLAAFPELKEVSEELKDSLVVISLSQDSKYYWEKASAQHQITWVNLNDFRERAGIFAHYGVVGIPHYVIISPEGKIVKTFTGYSKGRIKQKLSGIFPQYKKKD